jgi:hypothetical protein
MKLLRLVVLSLSAGLMCAGVSFAADAGMIQLCIAAPDPVVAGEQVTFQIIAANSGSSRWESGQYYLQAEIYDANQKFLVQTERLKGTMSVDPSGTTLVYVPFNVPTAFVGAYYYRVYLVFKEQRLIQTEYNSFNVIPLPATAAPKPAAFRVGGNVVVSYKQSTKYDGRDYTGNINVNLVGQMLERAMLFNMYTFHTPVSTSTSSGINNDIYSILFNYYGSGWTLGLGDVLPSFSQLSLYGSGMRGALYEGKAGVFSVGLVGARSAKPVEGNETTNGTYERWMLGAKAGLDLGDNIVVNGDIVNSFDRQESITAAGPSISPAGNNIAGANAQWNFWDTSYFSVDYQQSQYVPDIRTSTGALSDSAYRAELKLSPRNAVIRASYQETRPDFYAFGAPGATRDRQTADIYASYVFFSRLAANVGANQFHDNLKKEEGKTTTTQSIYSGGLSYSAPGKWPSPSVSVSQNTAKGDIVNSQDNQTNTISVSLMGHLSIINMGVTYQQMTFRDNTMVSDDLDTGSLGATVNTSFGNRLSLNFGLTQTTSKNLNPAKEFDTQAPTYSLSVTAGIVPEKLSLQMWGTSVTRKNNAVAAVDQIDSQETSVNAELTWLLRSSLSWTVGVSGAGLRDLVTTANDYYDHGINTRISYSF